MVRKEVFPIPDPTRREGPLVAKMFTAIAPTYDLLNHVLSLNVDRYWRRKAVDALSPEEGCFYVDLCTGTGDLALALLKRVKARVLGVDFSSGMLRRAGRKSGSNPNFLFARGNALALPLKNDSVDGVMVSFGVRNFEDLDRGFSEMVRVVKRGGKIVILELSTPSGKIFGAPFLFYFRHILPFLGRIASPSSSAYRYLPASVQALPDPEELSARLKKAGATPLFRRSLTGGIATLYCARKEV